MIYIGCVGAFGMVATACTYFFKFKPLHYKIANMPVMFEPFEDKLHKPVFSYQINNDLDESRESIVDPNRYIASRD